ncbi:unnamed protein product, partial [Dovyalis caffra]
CADRGATPTRDHVVAKASKVIDSFRLFAFTPTTPSNLKIPSQNRVHTHESQGFSGFDMQEKVMSKVEEEGFLGDFTSSSTTTSTSTPSCTKVKIKITKKQLEELLGKVEVKELSVQQILSQLINGSSDHGSYEPHHQPWRPNLQSIPE